MGERINLTKEEKTLYDKIIGIMGDVRKNVGTIGHSGNIKALEGLYKEMAENAHKLHMALKERGNEPRHHKYMIMNRGVPMDDVEFYKHIHPVEDLIAFINNSDANKDPEDSTIGVEFKIRIFTRRWGHYDVYGVKRTKDGWTLNAPAAFNSGDCDKTGEPFLYKSMKHDFVSYPYNMGYLLSELWEKAANGLSAEEIQNALDDISEWISICERNVPRGVFEDII